jgi:hypothetical protein
MISRYKKESARKMALRILKRATDDADCADNSNRDLRFAYGRLTEALASRVTLEFDLPDSSQDPSVDHKLVTPSHLTPARTFADFSKKVYASASWVDGSLITISLITAQSAAAVESGEAWA